MDLWEQRKETLIEEGEEVGRGLWEVVNKYKEVFQDKPGKAKNYECILQIKEYNEFMQKGYPIPYSKRLAVEGELKTMTENDIIEKSTSTYSNPLVVVMKRDGRVRLCLAARK